MIQKQFEDLLFKKYGVEKYGESGEEFNPERHQAVMMEVGDYKEETVVEAVKAAGLEVLEVTYQGEWVSVTARKNG